MPSNSLNLASRAKNRKYCSLHNELKPFLQEHSYSFPAYVKYIFINTVFPQIRPAGIIILNSLQMRVLLENTTFLLNKIVRIAGIIRLAGIIRGRALYEEIRYMVAINLFSLYFELKKMVLMIAQYISN